LSGAVGRSTPRAATRILRATSVITATALLLASSCSWILGTPIPAGIPPPPGDPVPQVNINLKKGQGRPADQLHAWAAERAPALGIPVTALEAYGYAARVAAELNPNCHLAWTTLAGIGMVESHHGTYGGATIAANGDVRPPIRGVVLDGTHGNMRIPDTDKGALDGDPTMDRAMGPMQFIPETWRHYGVDGNNDGIVSPDNVDDAALSAAGYLCSGRKDLATAAGWIAALHSYNYSDQYARSVRDWATAYAAGHSL